MQWRDASSPSASALWQGWDTDDIVPGSGVLSSVAIVVSGIILWVSAPAAGDLVDDRAERRRKLDAMVRQADEDGLYEVDADAYREALKETRTP